MNYVIKVKTPWNACQFQALSGKSIQTNWCVVNNVVDEGLNSKLGVAQAVSLL